MSNTTIYKQYAFKPDEREKIQSNKQIKNELLSKYKLYVHDYYPKVNNSKRNIPDDVNIDDYDLVYVREAGYHHSVCKCIKNSTSLTDDEIALMLDSYLLVFGYKKQGDGSYYIFED